ncbi:Crp/Fnr family transcriptional regulator [Listeria rustica]|uniref:Crp/Fnr family transcriptional regulator n=1 Tax=Listeria rustica TaxID=2713503 RepID=A0A7W1T698_9LIST|nr:Crp/Fnr family transcriptional regulator [Listeria rustica]MBA3926272.1 Crp/Fnr family transcriptional regulator [Listeria rustica]
MYRREDFETFSSIQNIIKLLKKDSAFNENCFQERLKKGSVVEFDTSFRGDIYIIESGFIKLNIDRDYVNAFQFILSRSDIPLLRTFTEDSPHQFVCSALTNVIWWKIDYDFYKKIMLIEDPKNMLLIHQLEKKQKELNTNYIKGVLNSRKRILFTISQLMEYGIYPSNNRLELPKFLTYSLLAELSNTSRSYAADILQDLRKRDIFYFQNKPWVINDVKQFKEILIEEGVPLI